MTKTKNETLLLIDGSNLAFRMFFALEMSNLRDSQGNPTWAVYGTLKALFDSIEFAKPTAIAAAFDLPEPTYRHEMFSEYKANRPDEMPDELQPQWELIKESFRKFHIPVIEEAGFEADDMIGIMAHKAKTNGQQVVILSGDKDLFQLVDDKVSMAVPKRGGGLEIYNPDKVFEKMGVTPEQVPDYKGIAGDSSDNIPGVKGLGPKAATKLLGEYQNLEGVYENIEQVGPPKTQEKLIAQEESARLSKHIATIITSEEGLKSNLDLDECNLDLPDTEELIEFLKNLEFNSILKRLPVILKPFNQGKLAKVNVGELPESNNGGSQSTKWETLEKPLVDLKIQGQIINTEDELDKLISKLEQKTQYALDLETDGLDTLRCQIVGWAIAINEEAEKIQAYYIPVRHNNIETQLKPDFVINKLKNILEDSNKLQILQNAKFEQKIFKKLKIKIHNNFFDTMIASYIDNPSNKHGLKAQSKRVFHERMVEIEDLIGTGKKQISIADAQLDQVADYAAADAYMTYRLYLHYNNKLDKRELKLLFEIEQPIVAVLREIELAGVTLDTKFLEGLSVEVHKEIKKIQAEIYKATQEEFNIASPKQLGEILFDKLELPVIKKNKKSGSYSTDIGTLETLLHDYELDKQGKKLIENIIEFRTLTKLASTYIDSLPTLINKEDQRLHSDFNQVVTATGRLSSSNPNLQNIPIKSHYGRQIRQAFVPQNSNYLILSADYSQIELRVLAHLAQEEALIDAFKNNQDIHKRTAMEIFELSEQEVGEDERRVGKTLNFALIYMQGPFATAKQLGISMGEAKSFIKKYFAAFKNIQPFMNEILENAHQNEYVETIFGRRRYFRNINSNNKILQKEEERQAFNAVIQGSAADIIKIAMISLQNKLTNKQYQSKLILQVHDELVLEVHKDELNEIEKLVKQEMSQATKLRVPLLVDLGSGDNWLIAK